MRQGTLPLASCRPLPGAEQPRFKQLFVLQTRPAATILERMEEQKACLFCGKIVDGSYQYCPHCGYEFGEGEELSALLDETMGDPSCDEGQDYLLRLRTLQELLADMERE